MTTSRAADAQPARGRLDEPIEPVELAVHPDAQRLKRARRRIDAHDSRAAESRGGRSPPAVPSCRPALRGAPRRCARAMRREKRSSPYSKIASASSRSLARATRSAAVSPSLRSMRMSSGSSRWKLKPRPARRTASTRRRGRRARRRRGAICRRSSTSSSDAVVGVHQLDAIAPRRERLARARERVAIAIEADERASRPLRAARARGRRGRPCSRRTGRRARAAGYCSTSAVMTGNVRHQMPNSDSARASSSVYGVALQLGEEAIVVPDVEVVVLAEHVDVAGHRGGVAQAHGDEHAPLRVELGGLAEVVDAIEKAEPRRDASTASGRAFLRSRATRASGRCGRTRRSGS